MTDFSEIRPYNDVEAKLACERIARHPMMPVISKYLLRDMPAGTLSNLFRSFENVDDFQHEVMVGLVESILDQTTSSYSVDGINYIKQLGDRKFLSISNHRDIFMDPLAIQYFQGRENIGISEICAGSNLLGNKLLDDLMKSNKMICVKRGISPRELYESSKVLSEYIRFSIASGSSSVWIAQREGRTKDGIDKTEQGILKMLDMSGSGNFQKDFEQLSIVPMSVSYEYEPCDARKAREVLIRRSGQTYVKKKNEDLHSILTGIRQNKGHMHIEICKPLSSKEIASAARLSGNERYQALVRILDNRIISGYRLWNTNYIAHDILHGEYAHADMYTRDERTAFESYVDRKVQKVSAGLDKSELRNAFLEIYANPVDGKASLK